MSLLSNTGVGEEHGGFYNGVATQSLRLDGGSQIALDNADAATSNKIATISTWFKRADETTTLAYLFHSKNSGSFNDGANGNASFSITLDAADTISVVQYNGNTTFNASQYDFGVVVQNRKFRDMSSWYHLVVAIDTTQGSGTTNEANRIKIYINGTQQTVVAISDGSGYQDFADENQLIAVNQAGEQRWGGTVDDGNYAHVYLAETIAVDGLQLAASNFGETKNGVWIAKSPSVSEFGNHGYRLQYKLSAVGSGSSSTIGADTSGKNNHFTSTGVAAHDSNMPDSPENNFSTMNSLINGYGTNITMSEGNLVGTGTNEQYNNTLGTILMTSGKWYWEISSANFNNYDMLGIAIETAIQTTDSTPYGQTGVVAYATQGAVYNESASGSGSYTDFLDSEIIGIAVDLDSGTKTFKFYNDNSLQGTIDLSSAFDNIGILPFFCIGNTDTIKVNFGADSSFAALKTSGSAEAQDGNGIGDFYYAPPSGYLALCSANLSDDDLPISPAQTTQATDHFNTLLYTGDGNDDRTVGASAGTGLAFKPDWAIFKGRDDDSRPMIYFDSTRGDSQQLRSDGTGASNTGQGQESSQSGKHKTFVAPTDTPPTNGGYTVGTDTSVNENNKGYVVWSWKANGGVTTSHSAGDNSATEASVSQANTTSGFSIVTYTGDTSGHGSAYPSTFNHGLGKTPRMILVKARTATQDWAVYHEDINTGSSYNHFLSLNTTAVRNSANNAHWGGNTMTLNDNLFSAGSSNLTGANGVNYVAYLFADVEGFSKFGNFTGNTSADGTFVALNFSPAMVIVKRATGSSTYDWFIHDNKRGAFNVNDERLAPNVGDKESTSITSMDFLSNGFKIRTANTSYNEETVIYMAFAEAPFKYANAR